MKNLNIKIFVIISILITATACSKPANNEESSDTVVETTSETAIERTDGIAPVLSGYLAMADALVIEDSQQAVEAGKSILSGLENVDESSISEDKMETYTKLAAMVKQSAEDIIEDVGHIDFQREHLEDLSMDMLELVDLLGAPKKLYKIHCPMAFDDKGADWLSDSKDVKNPYFGDAMLTCGAVTKEYEPSAQ